MFPLRFLIITSQFILHCKETNGFCSKFGYNLYDETDNLESIKNVTVKDQLFPFFNVVTQSQSILFITDCLGMESFGNKDITQFANITFAVVNISTFQTSEAQTLFKAEEKPFFLVHLEEQYVSEITKSIYESYHVPSRNAKQWQPTIIIAWKVPSRSAIGQLETIQKISKDIRLHLDSLLYIIFNQREEKSTNFLIGEEESIKIVSLGVWEVYGLKEQKKIAKIDNIAVSTFPKVKVIGKELILANHAKRRRNFSGGNLAASVKFDPYYTDWTNLITNEDGSYHLTGGYVSFIYNDLKMLMNFSEKIILGDSPFLLPNGSIVGITSNQLNSEEADLALNLISFSTYRAAAFTFLQPSYHSLTYVFFKQPSESSLRNIVVEAFSRQLWHALVGVLALLVLIIKIRTRLFLRNWSESNFFVIPSVSIIEDNRFASEGLMWSLAAVCQKTWYLDPRSNSLRMKVLIGSLTFFITYTAYSASIVSDLAFNNVPVKNFDDLINLNFHFTVHESSVPYQDMLRGMITSYNLNQTVLETSTEKEVSHLFTGNHLQAESNPESVRSTKAAFLSPADMFYKTAESLNYTDNFMCEHISALSASSYLSKSAMLVKKGSQYKEVLNLMLIYLRTRGLLHRIIHTYNTGNFLRCIPMDQRDTKVSPADTSDVFTVLLVLIIGQCSALLIMLMEMVLLNGNCRNFSQWCNQMRKYLTSKGESKNEGQMHFDKVMRTYYYTA